MKECERDEKVSPDYQGPRRQKEVWRMSNTRHSSPKLARWRRDERQRMSRAAISYTQQLYQETEDELGFCQAK
jgi:hypothetical protein